MDPPNQAWLTTTQSKKTLQRFIDEGDMNFEAAESAMKKRKFLLNRVMRTTCKPVLIKICSQDYGSSLFRYNIVGIY